LPEQPWPRGDKKNEIKKTSSQAVNLLVADENAMKDITIRTLSNMTIEMTAASAGAAEGEEVPGKGGKKELKIKEGRKGNQTFPGTQYSADLRASAPAH